MASTCQWMVEPLPACSEVVIPAQAGMQRSCVSTVQFFTGDKGVFQQAGPGHGADSTRYRGNPGGTFGSCFKVHVTPQASVFHAVDADINDNGSGFDPLALDQAGLAHRHNHQVGTAYMLFQVIGKPVG